MKSLRIYNSQNNDVSTVENMSFPFMRVDDDNFITDLQGFALPLIDAYGCRFQRTLDEQIEEWATPEYRHMVLLVSGQIELSLGDGSAALLQPGDVYLVDDLVGKGHRTKRIGDCRTIQILVPDSWTCEGDAPPPCGYQHTAKERPNLKRMYTGDNGKSYFRSFDTLFSDTSGRLSPIKPCIGFFFNSVADKYVYDWHPEVTNNFVFVMQGGLELEVGGEEGEIEIFGPGDVCLAEDRVGQGHIDRMHGEVCLALIVFATENLW